MLTSNGRPVPFDDRYFGVLRSSTDIADSPEAVRERFTEDGFLYLPGLLDEAAVLGMRAAYFATPEGTTSGVSDEERKLAWTGRSRREHGTPGHRAHTFVRSELFRDFTDQAVLRSVAETILGDEAQILPRRIVREYRSGDRRATRAHTDLAYINQSNDRFVTAWLPIGDCRIEMGPLVYLEQSHRLDPSALAAVRAVTDRPSDLRPLSHDLAWVARRLKRRWLTTGFRAGDVVFHSAEIVHASLDTSHGVRVSADLRFIPLGDAPDSRWTAPWAGNDGY